MGLRALAAVLVSALIVGLAAVQPAVSQTPPLSAAPAAARLDKADVDVWLDGYVGEALTKGDIAGAVVVVVKDGQVLTARGYGYADVATKHRVDPDATMFRPGSISKLFTWTAVMQLVEQGRLDLDADINRYLDFDVTGRDGASITLRHLMTHTAGFEEHLKDLYTTDPARLVSLETYIKRWVPPRAYPVGQVPSYSNYGTALAGYIVQRVSGQAFDDYIEARIFAPLGMRNSTFRQPLPAQFRGQMATPYLRGSGPARPYELVNPRPAGSLSATGSDIARFMIAHLQRGRYGETRILGEETARLMHAEQTKLNPPLNAMALGFYREDRNGRSVIGHAGATEGFYSNLHLLIDDNVGVFISMNSAGRDVAAGGVIRVLLRDFMDRYYPAPASPRLPTTTTAMEHAKAMQGYYWPTRRMDSTFFSSLKLLRQTRVTARDDGTIVVDAIRNPDGRPKVWREIGPYLWEDEARATRLAAVVRDGKVINYATDGAAPVNVMQRVPVWAEAGWSKPALNGVVLYFGLIVALWPLSAVAGWFLKRRFAPRGRRLLLYRLVRAGAVCGLLTVGASLMALSQLGASFMTMDSHIDPAIRAAQVFAAGAFLGGLASLANALAVWRDHTARWWGRLCSLASVAAFALFAWFALTLNLFTATTMF